MSASAATRWPTAVDYQTALQIPAICFQSEEMQQAEVKTSMLGLPLVATGNVAVVFRIVRNGQDYALRCFTRRLPLDEVAERYAVLNKYFSRHKLDALVETELLMDEIFVAEGLYPVAMMPWLPGRQLHLYIEDHLDDPDALRKLAKSWRSLMKRLRSKDVAHGDLSDGNVLVDKEGKIRLIDYDAAFVPPLRDKPPSELGKPNYQHPARLAEGGPHYGYYAADVDAFASLVIYVSILALAADPDLWDVYHMGDNLIFVQDDYKKPGSTPIWPNLRSSKDLEVRKLTDMLERYCLASIKGLPTLENAIKGKGPSVSRSAPPESPSVSVPIPQESQPKIDPALEAMETVEFDPRMMMQEVERARAAKQAHAEPSTAPPQDRAPQPKAAAADKVQAPKKSGSNNTARIIGWVVAIAILLLGAIAAIAFIPVGEQETDPTPAVPEATEQTAPPPLPPRSVSASDLPGFYVGYTTRPDGTREALGLTLEPPSSLDSPEQLQFSMNSRLYQVEGIGIYDPGTKQIDLENQYILDVSFNQNNQVMLTSLMAEGEETPLLQVTKTD